jgi:molybdopterin/thiamine biosynthesis adenylyltransferase
MGQELKTLEKTSTVSQTSIRLRGKRIPGAEDRQSKIAGFNQTVFSSSKVLCIGAGGLISHIAPTLARKGIGALTILDDDVVEPSNLNRQHFYEKDLYQNKALALAQNLQGECIHESLLTGYALCFQQAVDRGIDLGCNVAICGVDNNPTRVAASQYFRQRHLPVIFTAVSADADHGYVFIQEADGACFGCLFPDAADSKTYPCPGTPAIADILQFVGALTVYVVDSYLMGRPRTWTYRHVYLSGDMSQACSIVAQRAGCAGCCREK